MYSQLSALKDRMPTRCVSRPSRVARRSRSPRGRASVPLPTFRRFPRNPFRLPEMPERFRHPGFPRLAPRPASRRLTPLPSVSHPPLPCRHRDSVEEVLLGAGANGLAFVEGPRVSVAFEGDVAVYFQGRLLAELADSVESFAHEILHRYQSRQITGTRDFPDPPAFSFSAPLASETPD